MMAGVCEKVKTDVCEKVKTDVTYEVRVGAGCEGVMWVDDLTVT